MTIVLLIFGLLLFIGLVLIHEWGHFIMARRNGVEVEEFGLGFPPRAKTLTKRNGTVFSLNWLPLGGFVKLKGEHDSDTKKGTFGAASLLAKTKIMVAGVVMNLVTAFLLFTLLALVGIPTLITKQNQNEDQFSVASDKHLVTQRVIINYIEPGSPADQAGLRKLDRVVSFTPSASEYIFDAEGKKVTERRGTGEPQPVATIEQLRTFTKNDAGEKVVLTYEREGKQHQAPIQVRSSDEIEASLKTDKPKGYVGIALASYEVNRYTWSAPVVAAGLTGQITKLTLKGLGSAVSGLGGILAGAATNNTTARQNAQTQATEQVSGPLGIFFVLQSGAHEGITMVLFIIAIISLTLAIMNILPIPALDGGRLFVTYLFRIIKKPLGASLEDKIHGSGFAILMLLFVLITFVDIGRFF